MISLQIQHSNDASGCQHQDNTITTFQGGGDCVPEREKKIAQSSFLIMVLIHFYLTRANLKTMRLMLKTAFISRLFIFLFKILLGQPVQGDIEQTKICMIENTRKLRFSQPRMMNDSTGGSFISKGSRGTPEPFFILYNRVFPINLCFQTALNHLSTIK